MAISHLELLDLLDGQKDSAATAAAAAADEAAWEREVGAIGERTAEAVLCDALDDDTFDINSGHSNPHGAPGTASTSPEVHAGSDVFAGDRCLLGGGDSADYDDGAGIDGRWGGVDIVDVLQVALSNSPQLSGSAPDAACSAEPAAAAAAATGSGLVGGLEQQLPPQTAVADDASVVSFDMSAAVWEYESPMKKGLWIGYYSFEELEGWVVTPVGGINGNTRMRCSILKVEATWDAINNGDVIIQREDLIRMAAAVQRGYGFGGVEQQQQVQQQQQQQHTPHHTPQQEELPGVNPNAMPWQPPAAVYPVSQQKQQQQQPRVHSPPNAAASAGSASAGAAGAAAELPAKDEWATAELVKLMKANPQLRFHVPPVVVAGHLASLSTDKEARQFLLAEFGGHPAVGNFFEAYCERRWPYMQQRNLFARAAPQHQQQPQMMKPKQQRQPISPFQGPLGIGYLFVVSPPLAHTHTALPPPPSFHPSPTSFHPPQHSADGPCCWHPVQLSGALLGSSGPTATEEEQRRDGRGTRARTPTLGETTPVPGTIVCLYANKQRGHNRV